MNKSHEHAFKAVSGHLVNEKLSAVITTYNNAATLAKCLASIQCADEIVVLDSYSSDATLDIAKSSEARCIQEAFKGYGPQKQSAIEHAKHDWILLLDADEELTAEANAVIRNALLAPQSAGFRLWRRERRFWRWQHPKAHHVDMLRLFDRRCVRMSEGVHASPQLRTTAQADQVVTQLPAIFLHHGEVSIEVKVAKINMYSTALARERKPRSMVYHALRLLFYPPIFFLRQYLFKRQFLNGWAGLIGSLIESFYVFLKDAKAIEQRKNKAP